MGCVPENKIAYRDNDSLYSNRSVRGEEMTPNLHHQFVSMACGYGFDLNNQDIEQIMRRSNRQIMIQNQQQKYERLVQIYEQIKKIYKEHEIDSCIPLVRQAQNLLATTNFALIAVEQGVIDQIKEKVENIGQQFNLMIHFANEIERGGWQFQGEEDNVRISTRRQGDTVGTLMESVIDIPIEIFLTVLSQMDYLTDLMDEVKISREEKNLGRNHKIGYSLYDFPIVSSRQAIFDAVGYDRLKHNNTLFMFSRSIHNNVKVCKKYGYQPKINPKYVQVQYKYFIVKYVPISENRGQVTIAMNIDMKMNFVPLWMMEMVCKIFCKNFFKVVMRASLKFKGSKWEKKIEKHPQTFEFFKGIVKKYLRGKSGG